MRIFKFEKLENGRSVFARMHNVWDGKNWNDGYESLGRFWVYRPDCPGASRMGYQKRARVVWWLLHKKLKRNQDIHHKNKNKLDDRAENLECLGHKEHAKIHQKKIFKKCLCNFCGKVFNRKPNRFRYKNNFCSQECYKKFPRTNRREKRNCKFCGLEFSVIKSRKKQLCSNSCSANFKWRKNKCLASS